jgi:hypothetical protein
MALGSQVANASLISEITGLTHDIFVGDVKNNVRRESPTASLFNDALPSGDYRLEGQNMVFAVYLDHKTGTMFTNGNLPDHTAMDAVQGKITPVRRFARLALDNFVEKRASGPGAFEDIGSQIFDLLWDSWKSSDIRAAIGPASSLLGLCESRSSSTQFVIKDGFGNTGTNPCSHISIGSILCWYDLTATAAIDGAGTVTAIAHSTRTITVTTSGTWEPADQLAAGDYIYFATTPNIATDYFVAEKDLGPNGLGTIVDPAAAASTVFNISETTSPRWKPFREASSTFDHLELTEHHQKLAAKRGFAVTPQTDVCVTFPSNLAQLARSLMGFQQSAYKGETLYGGYGSIVINGMEIVPDHFFYHNVLMTLNKESLFRITLGDDADFKADDGSMWSRLQDFDGKEAYVGEYGNFFCNHRGANGALTGITTDVTDTGWEPVPNY